jgi:hypothetical protein
MSLRTVSEFGSVEFSPFAPYFSGRQYRFFLRSEDTSFMQARCVISSGANFVSSDSGAS